MGITDELRREVANYPFRDNRDFALFEAIADRIDIAHKHAIGYVDDRDPDTMAENGWVRLPKDADGVPIRVGDKVYQVKGGWVCTVKSITFYPDNTTVSFDGEHGYGCDSAHNVHHYHEPTVEDLLREFGRGWHEQMNGPETFDVADYVERYAAKFRLAGDGKEQ